MGTTMVAATIVGQLRLCGECRRQSSLCDRSHRLQQVTKDHSLVQEMVRLGELDPEEASAKSSRKKYYHEALGAEKAVNIDFFDLKLEPGDVV
ncbi:MAG: hypothetical protein ACLUTZ_13750 [Oliverpabstia sp.]